MPLITIDGSGEEFECLPGEPLLRGGLRAGLGMPYECSVGGCGTCKVQILDGEAEMAWAEAPGLSDRDRRKGRMLACQAVPLGDCRVKLRLDEACVPAVRPEKQSVELAARRAITHDIQEFRFKAEGPAAFKAGQYALLTLPGVTGARAYSMSNLANDQGFWDFQIRRVPDGRATEHLFDRAKPGDRFELDGPYGLAFLRDTGRDVVCVAGGSGLAPMISIARAFAEDPAFEGRMLHFIYGAREPLDICGEDMLRALPDFGTRIFYHPIVSDLEAAGRDRWPGRTGFVHTHIEDVLARTPDEYEYYFAGPPVMAAAIETLMTEDHGVPQNQLHYDRFF